MRGQPLYVAPGAEGFMGPLMLWPSDHRALSIKPSPPTVMLVWFDYDCVCMWTHVTAGEDAADGSMPSADVLTSAVLRCYTLYPNEWEKTHLGVSSLWQEGPIWTPHHRWVSASLLNSFETVKAPNSFLCPSVTCCSELQCTQFFFVSLPKLNNNYWTSFLQRYYQMFCLS